MRILYTIILCFAVLFELSAQVSVNTNRVTSRYEVGEEVSFLVNAATAGVANYSIRYDDVATPVQSGTINVVPGVDIPINFTSNENNHVICEVNFDGQYVKAGAAIGCFDIDPLEAKPADFKGFWNNLIAQSNGIPLDPEVTPHSSTPYSTSYKLSLANIDGKRVYGYITIPIGEGPFPAIITFPPFGIDPSIVTPEIAFSEWSNAISVSLSIHNVDVELVDPNAYTGEDITDRDKIYFKAGIIGAVRAVDYLMTRPDFNQTNICSYGVSQGGGLAMIYAGVDERVDVLMTTNPSFCEHVGLHYDRASGFPNYVKKSRGEVGTAAHELQTIAATKYYDAVHAASFFDGPTLMSVSYLDGIAPGGASFTAFNQLQSDFKVMVHAPKLGHTNATEFWNDKFKMLNRVWPESTANRPFPWAIETTGHFIDAGNDKSITGMQSTLSGSIELDGANMTNFPVKWEKISGPGHVAISNPNSLTTDVTFGDNGTYVIKFSADDNATYAANDVYYTIEDYITFEVEGILSSNVDIESTQSLQISPNPAQSDLTVQCLNCLNLDALSLKIYNQQGQLINTNNLALLQNNQQLSLNTSLFSNGLYFLSVESAGKTLTKSFIIAN